MSFVEAEMSSFFSLEGVPLILIAWLFIYIFRPISTIIHELGHAIIASFMTDQLVKIKVGVGEKSFHLRVKRIEILLAPKMMISGHTAFSELNLTKLQLLSILFAGPFFSALASVLGIYLIYQTKLHSAIDAVLVGWICSHLLCFIRNALPAHLQDPVNKDSRGVPSDGLQIYRILKQRS
jgi:hypothetical protein